jgi:Flp pilus assembly protein TadG
MDERTRRDPQRGTAALEFALVVPIMVLLFVGLATFGRAFVLRYQMSDAALVASRAGVITGRTDTASATLVVQNRLGGSTSICNPLLVATDTVDLGGVQAFRVTVTCSWGLLRDDTGASRPIVASAATPWFQPGSGATASADSRRW